MLNTQICKEAIWKGGLRQLFTNVKVPLLRRC